MTVAETAKKEPNSLIGRAFAFAQKAHAGQKRKSGEPYFAHPLAAAETLKRWGLDETTIAGGLLHDVVEDTAVTEETLRKEFGGEIVFLIGGVTKLSNIKYHGGGGAKADAPASLKLSQDKSAETRLDDTTPLAQKPIRTKPPALSAISAKAENLRKMFLAVSQDLRVVFIRLADRLHNMRTLGALPPIKQKRIALETDEIYAPIAYRLGMQNLSGELQDLAFPYLYPKENRWLHDTLDERYEERRVYLKRIKPTLEAALKVHDIKPITIDFRAKRYSSLYHKLLRHDMDIDRIYDLVAMRIIVTTVEECYAVLGILHQLWPPLPGRIKDYIAMPKPNGYRSLHTTVIGPDQKFVELQIRTRQMHEENENGIAAHWLYEQQKKSSGGFLSGLSFRKKDPQNHEELKQSLQKISEEVRWVQQLRNWQEKFRDPNVDPEEFVRSMKIDFFSDRIFAITPKGDVIDLPAGATPVDFAYHIHSAVGNTCIGAKVNNGHVALNHELRSGDLVEILTQKNKRPSEDWLKFAKTSVARDHIKAALRQKQSSLRAAHPPSRTELRLVVQNRIGLIKDISTVIARSHVSIVSFQALDPHGSKFPIDKVEIATTDRRKIENLVLKLKNIKEVKEVSYRIV